MVSDTSARAHGGRGEIRLKIEGLTSCYGRIRALRDVTVEVETGEIVAIIGPNGAGKTTLLNTISGLVHAETGSIAFEGRPITNLSSHRIVALGISQVPERRHVFDTMSVRDNLILGAYHRLRRDPRTPIERDIKHMCQLFPLLADRLDRPAGTLSGGMQQMLAIARGLMADPKLLLLDEPSLGLAPLLVQEIFRVIGELRQNGTTILLVEQNGRAALRVADRGYVLENGRVMMSGTAGDLARDENLQRAYLGHTKSNNGSSPRSKAASSGQP